MTLDAAFGRLFKALERMHPFGPIRGAVHVNYGYSDAYTEGFNAGYDAADSPEPDWCGRSYAWTSPDNAYRSGYCSGWTFANTPEDDPNG